MKQEKELLDEQRQAYVAPCVIQHSLQFAGGAMLSGSKDLTNPGQFSINRQKGGSTNGTAQGDINNSGNLTADAYGIGSWEVF
ncbi:MAG: hypothetical protein HUK02_04920 [Bacteroidaceae bacterium]|nr:hypothetical protein [Bacteroidaceae bacterium]